MATLGAGVAAFGDIVGNVIVGRLIPAGTGGMLERLKKVATHRDDLISEERAKENAAYLAEQEAAG